MTSTTTIHIPIDVEVQVPVAAAQSLYPSVINEAMERGEPAAGVPMGEPATGVPMGIPIDTIELVEKSVNKGLSPEDLDAAKPLAVTDWRKLAAGKHQPERTGFKAVLYACCSCCYPAPEPHPDEALLRVGKADGGGVKVFAIVKSPESILLLARRLAASKSAKIAALDITCADGYGPGTANPVYASGEGFALITRALMPPPQGSRCLAELRELAMSKVIVDDANAAALAAALRGSASLDSLELWNVQLEDAGALALGTLAAEGGAPNLRSLNLGKNLISGSAKERIEGAKRPDVLEVRML